MRMGSLFSGVGGFDLALERCGMETAWFVENDKQCQQVLRHHWPKAEVYGDIREAGSVRHIQSDGNGGANGDASIGRARRGMRSSDSEGPSGERSTVLAPVDLISGGFPCQDYSVAGKRGGLAGDRGALWWEMRRVIADILPTWIIGENVPGLLSSNGGRDFLTIIASLVQLGYGCTWAVLDSQYFGVAQRRRRLFIVGHSGGGPRPEILALSEGLFGHPAPERTAGKEAPTLFASGAGTERTASAGSEAEFCIEQEVAGSLGGRAQGEGGFRQDLDNHGACPLAFKPSHYTRGKDGAPSDVFPPLSADADKGDQDPVIAFDSKQGGESEGGVAPTLRAMSHDKSHPNAGGQVAVFRKAQKAHDPEDCERWEEAEHANTLSTHGTTTSEIALGPTVPRRLIPTECERLQGFPDGHTDVDGMKDGPRYRMMGNAVTVDVVEWIGRRIMQAEAPEQA